MLMILLYVLIIVIYNQEIANKTKDYKIYKIYINLVFKSKKLDYKNKKK